MKKISFIFVLLVFLISACTQKENQDTLNAKKIIEYHKKKFDNLQLSGKIVNGVREVDVKAIQYRWEPENIVVKKVEKIKFII